jgi:hypothetical protein
MDVKNLLRVRAMGVKRQGTRSPRCCFRLMRCFSRHAQNAVTSWSSSDVLLQQGGRASAHRILTLSPASFMLLLLLLLLQA